MGAGRAEGEGASREEGSENHRSPRPVKRGIQYGLLAAGIKKRGSCGSSWNRTEKLVGMTATTPRKVMNAKSSTPSSSTRMPGEALRSKSRDRKGRLAEEGKQTHPLETKVGQRIHACTAGGHVQEMSSKAIRLA